MTRFSVLIPVYNAERTLKRCVDSVLNQTLRDFEIIIINDGSSDHSGHVCDEYANQDPRIKVLHQTNRGALLTRIVGIKAATGQFFMFLDSDDWLERSMLETVDRIIKEHDCDVVMYNYRCITDTTEWIVEPVFANWSVFTDDNRTTLYKEFLTRDNINSMSTKVVKRELFEDDMDYSTLPRRVTMGEDALQSIHIYRKFRKLVYTSEPLLCYYINVSGITRTAKSEVYYLDCNVVFEAKLKFMNEIGLNNPEALSSIAEHYMLTISNYLLTMNRSRLPIKHEVQVYRDMRTAAIFEQMSSYLLTKELSLHSPTRAIRGMPTALSLLFDRKYLRLYTYLMISRQYYRILGATRRLVRYIL